MPHIPRGKQCGASRDDVMKRRSGAAFSTCVALSLSGHGLVGRPISSCALLSLSRHRSWEQAKHGMPRACTIAQWAERAHGRASASTRKLILHTIYFRPDAGPTKPSSRGARRDEDVRADSWHPRGISFENRAAAASHDPALAGTIQDRIGLWPVGNYGAPRKWKRLRDLSEQARI